MSTSEVYKIRQNLSEKKKYTWDYAYWLESGDTIDSVGTSTSPSSGLTVAGGTGTNYINVTIGAATTAATYTITVTTTTANGEIDLFKVSLEAVADSA